MDKLNISGREVRVECNFNAIMAFMEMRGLKNLDFLSQEFTTPQWLDMMACCINEGERLEGRPADFTALKLGELPMMEIAGLLTSFITVFARQCSGDKTERQ